MLFGNGPSLDGLVDTLRNNLQGAVIFSCGSTTGTLCKLGIIPDFHVEMERTADTEPVILNGTTEEFRRQVKIIALNTVYPDSLALFNKAYIAKKPNDAGDELINLESSDKLPISSINAIILSQELNR